MKLKELKTCPMCGGNGIKKFYDIGKTSVYSCKCGFKFLNPCLDEEEMRKIYYSSDSLNEVNPALQQYYDVKNLEKKSKTLKNFNMYLSTAENNTMRGTLFEVGYGNGLFLAHAKSKGWDVFGVDTSAQNAKIVQDSFGINVDVGDFESYKASDNSFDAVAMLDVIEHVSYPKEFLKKTRQIVKSGGVLIIATPNCSGIVPKVAGLLYKLSFGKIKFPVKLFYVLEHTAYYNKNTLERLLKEVGLEVVKTVKHDPDLERYKFSFTSRFAARVLMFFGKLFGMQNRLLVIARKKRCLKV